MREGCRRSESRGPRSRPWRRAGWGPPQALPERSRAVDRALTRRSTTARRVPAHASRHRARQAPGASRGGPHPARGTEADARRRIQGLAAGSSVRLLAGGGRRGGGSGASVPDPDGDGGAEDQRGGDQLGAPVRAEDDARGLGLAGPRREPREVEERRGLPGPRVRRHPEDEGDVVRPVGRLDVVRAFAQSPAAPDHLGDQRAVGLGRPAPLRVVERGAHDVVHLGPFRHGHDIVGHPQPAEEERLAPAVVLDPPAGVVVAYLRAGLPPVDQEEAQRPDRRPAPLPEHPAGLDPVGDPRTLALGVDVVAPPSVVHRLVDAPDQLEVQDPVEDGHARGVARRPRRGQSQRPEGGTQRQREGPAQKRPPADPHFRRETPRRRDPVAAGSLEHHISISPARRHPDAEQDRSRPHRLGRRHALAQDHGGQGHPDQRLEVHEDRRHGRAHGLHPAVVPDVRQGPQGPLEEHHPPGWQRRPGRPWKRRRGDHRQRDQDGGAHQVGAQGRGPGRQAGQDPLAVQGVGRPADLTQDHDGVTQMGGRTPGRRRLPRLTVRSTPAAEQATPAHWSRETLREEEVASDGDQDRGRGGQDHGVRRRGELHPQVVDPGGHGDPGQPENDQAMYVPPGDRGLVLLRRRARRARRARPTPARSGGRPA